MPLVCLHRRQGPNMARHVFLAVFLLAISSFAQVTVTNSGFATSSGPVYPAVPVSPPILYTPTIHLGQAPTQPIQATGEANGIGLQPVVVVGTVPERQNQAPTAATEQASPNFFNFGAAQFGESSAAGSADSTKNLAEVAREQRRHPNGSNARIYTNSDIDQLNQTGNMVNMPSAQANMTNDNWSPNNGIISPEPPQQNAVGSPAQQDEQYQPPTGLRNPFAPKPQSNSPTGIETTPSQPQSRPQAEIRPFSTRPGTEQIAQNNPQHEPLAQMHASTETQAQASEAANQPQAAELPRTASRLPLLGVAGLFSVSMGLFVRYQRAKAR
jgi:hypothetical protein